MLITLTPSPLGTLIKWVLAAASVSWEYWEQAKWSWSRAIGYWQEPNKVTSMTAAHLLIKGDEMAKWTLFFVGKLGDTCYYLPTTNYQMKSKSYKNGTFKIWVRPTNPPKAVDFTMDWVDPRANTKPKRKLAQ